jgi:hypothetical protein
MSALRILEHSLLVPVGNSGRLALSMTTASLLWDHHGPLPDDHAVKTNLGTPGCLRGLDQGLARARARCSRNRPLEPLCTRARLTRGLAGHRCRPRRMPLTSMGDSGAPGLRTLTRGAWSQAWRIEKWQATSHRLLLTSAHMGTGRSQRKRTGTRGRWPLSVRCSTFCTECLGHEGSRMALVKRPEAIAENGFGRSDTPTRRSNTPGSTLPSGAIDIDPARPP